VPHSLCAPCSSLYDSKCTILVELGIARCPVSKTSTSFAFFLSVATFVTENIG